jgi:hypothetical protein
MFRAIDPDKPLVRQHAWIYFALGRTCFVCKLTQPRDEFDDAIPCEGAPNGA